MKDVCAVSCNDATDDDLHDVKTKISIATLTCSHTFEIYRMRKKSHRLKSKLMRCRGDSLRAWTCNQDAPCACSTSIKSQ